MPGVMLLQLPSRTLHTESVTVTPQVNHIVLSQFTTKHTATQGTLSCKPGEPLCLTSQEWSTKFLQTLSRPSDRNLPLACHRPSLLDYLTLPVRATRIRPYFGDGNFNNTVIEHSSLHPLTLFRYRLTLQSANLWRCQLRTGQQDNKRQE